MSAGAVSFKIVLLGEGNVGKTAIKQRYLGEGFKGKYNMTIGADFAVKRVDYNNTTYVIQIWDLAGQSGFLNTRKMYYGGAMAALLVFDIDRPLSFNNLDMWIREIQDNRGELIPIILIGNKADLREEGKDQVSMQDAKDYAAELAQRTGYNVVYIETSALEGSNVEFAFQAIVNYIEKLRGKDIDFVLDQKLIDQKAEGMNPDSEVEQEEVVSNEVQSVEVEDSIVVSDIISQDAENATEPDSIRDKDSNTEKVNKRHTIPKAILTDNDNNFTDTNQNTESKSETAESLETMSDTLKADAKTEETFRHDDQAETLEGEESHELDTTTQEEKEPKQAVTSDTLSESVPSIEPSTDSKSETVGQSLSTGISDEDTQNISSGTDFSVDTETSVVEDVREELKPVGVESENRDHDELHQNDVSTNQTELEIHREFSKKIFKQRKSRLKRKKSRYRKTKDDSKRKGKRR